MAEIRYVTVQALTKYIKRKFDYDPHLQNIYVKGEISNFKKHSSGHMYFTLKDDKARILAVMFATNAQHLRFIPEDGLNVLVRGEITVYEPNGQYQLYVKEMQPDGIGELYLAFEQLKKKLEKEGLFKRELKKTIPPYPKKVGVITSPTGAAIRDIITTIKRRYPVAKIIIYPALVQGIQAAPSIARAIDLANERKEADVLIIGRGGGSIEELWAFNEEVVARAIFRSTIPIISAVGHETDVTISDFVADVRAPTPTGAAELAVPSVEELMEKILNRKIRLIRMMKNKIEGGKMEFARLRNSYAFRYPRKLVDQKTETLDRKVEELNRTVKLSISDKKQAWEQLYLRTRRNHPEKTYRMASEKYMVLIKRLKKGSESTLKQKGMEFKNLIGTLEALSPLKVMERGYSIVYNERDRIIKSIDQIDTDDRVIITVSDGDIHAKVTGKSMGKEKGNERKGKDHL